MVRRRLVLWLMLMAAQAAEPEALMALGAVAYCQQGQVRPAAALLVESQHQ